MSKRIQIAEAELRLAEAELNLLKLQEQRLEEGKKLKAAILAGLMAFTGLVGAHANGLKDAADWNKGAKQVQKELIADYGKDGNIPKADIKKMIKACTKSYKDEGEWLWNDNDSQEQLADSLEQLGFETAAQNVKNMNLTFENTWDAEVGS